MRFPLWQRIFVYTTGLLVFSQVLAFFLHTSLSRGNFHKFFADTARAVVGELSGHTLETTLAHTRLYSSMQHRIWLTQPDGSAIAGENFSKDTLAKYHIMKEWDQDGMRMVEVRSDPRFWIISPIQLQEGPYLLYLSFGPPPPPRPRPGFLFSLFTPVLLVSCTLALWMAWRVSRPLRKLSNEVREMRETGPEYAVTVAGKDEISEVANAVNSMAAALDRHVRGMRAFVVNISHELRSPLARANLALGILEDALPPEYVRPPENVPENSPESAPPSPAGAKRRLAAKYLAVLQEELAHMEMLIGTTLLTQKIEMRQENIGMKPVDFSALCEDAWARYNPMLARAALVTSEAIALGLVVSGNRTLLLQLLSNLLDNCLKYTPAGGEVRFTLQARQNKCLLCVENSHDQIDAAALDHIFDPFYRIDQVTGTGVGLGLSLVQKTVVLHGGEIMAVPTEMGLCICMQLPLAPESETTAT